MIKFDGGKTTQKKKDDQLNNKTQQLITKWMLQQVVGSPEAKNTYYQILAEENNVKDLPTLIKEIEYRWKGNPWLGGYNPTLEMVFNSPKPAIEPSQHKKLIELFKPTKKQQGGTMNNQEELQKAFMAYLIEDAAAQGVQIQSEEQLKAYVEQLGQEGLKAKYQQFMQKMQGGTMARLGAKLQYYKKLKGACPEGEELVYFKQGGRICKACQKVQKGTAVTKKVNEVDKFKASRAQYKKDMKSAKDEASRDSISINKYNDQEVMANNGHKGNFKNGKWVPNRTKYTKKD